MINYNTKYSDKHIVIDEMTLRYWDIGKGKDVVLLLHGFGGACEEWIFNIPELAKFFRVIALDIPGQGFSSKPKTDYSYDFYTKILNDFLENLHIKKLNVVGHSVGGMIGLHFSIKNQDKVLRLLLISPSCNQKYSLIYHILSVPLLGELLFKPPKDIYQVKNSFKGLTFNNFELPEFVLNQAYKSYNSTGYKEASLRYLRRNLNIFGINTYGKKFLTLIKHSFTNYKIPVFLVWGKQDRIVPISSSKFFTNHKLNLKVWEIDNRGHNPHWEHHNMVNKKMISFLKETDGPQQRAISPY